MNTTLETGEGGRVKYKECKSEQITLMKGESLFSGSVSASFVPDYGMF